VFMILYGIVRNIGELFRDPDAALIGPLTRGQAYSIPMIIVGVCFVAYALSRKPVAA
jgi:phosphatidylglycerol---prolipoprotein diacylglyceryl transferase